MKVSHLFFVKCTFVKCCIFYFRYQVDQLKTRNYKFCHYACNLKSQNLNYDGGVINLLNYGGHLNNILEPCLLPAASMNLAFVNIYYPIVFREPQVFNSYSLSTLYCNFHHLHLHSLLCVLKGVKQYYLKYI